MSTLKLSSVSIYASDGKFVKFLQVPYLLHRENFQTQKFSPIFSLFSIGQAILKLLSKKKIYIFLKKFSKNVICGFMQHLRKNFLNNF